VDKSSLVERARSNRQRAQKCRELMRLIKNQQSIAMLDEFAQELEATAARLELEAQGITAKPAAAALAAAGQKRP
jgi:hypothetical protein